MKKTRKEESGRCLATIWTHLLHSVKCGLAAGNRSPPASLATCVSPLLSFSINLECFSSVLAQSLGHSLRKMSATKTQSQKIFEKLKTKPANKVGSRCPCASIVNLTGPRYALTVDRRIQHGPLCLLASIYVLTAPRIIVTSASTSPSSARRIWTVMCPFTDHKQMH